MIEIQQYPYWLSFAEAKNAALIAFNIAVLTAMLVYSTGINVKSVSLNETRW